MTTLQEAKLLPAGKRRILGLKAVEGGLRVLQTMPIEAATREELLEALVMTQTLGKIYKEAKAIMDEGLLEALERHGEVEVNETRYYVGEASKTERRGSLSGIFRALWAAAGGDDEALDHGVLETVSEAFASGAFKQSEVRHLLGADGWGEFYRKVKIEEVKEGKPRKGKGAPKRRVVAMPKAISDRLAKAREARS